jgi:hypothetical protein
LHQNVPIDIESVITKTTIESIDKFHDGGLIIDRYLNKTGIFVLKINTRGL